MLSTHESLAPSTCSFVAVRVVTAILGVALAGCGLFGRSEGQAKGEPESVLRVLIIGPNQDLADPISRWGFDANHLSFGAGVREGQRFDPELDDLAAIVEFADQAGYGYVALDMLDGHSYDFAGAEYEAPEPPPGTTVTVISVGDLGHHVSFGGVPAAVAHPYPHRAEVGILPRCSASPRSPRPGLATPTVI